MIAEAHQPGAEPGVQRALREAPATGATRSAARSASTSSGQLGPSSHGPAARPPTRRSPGRSPRPAPLRPPAWPGGELGVGLDRAAAVGLEVADASGQVVLGRLRVGELGLAPHHLGHHRTSWAADQAARLRLDRSRGLGGAAASGCARRGGIVGIRLGLDLDLGLARPVRRPPGSPSSPGRWARRRPARPRARPARHRPRPAFRGSRSARWASAADCSASHTRASATRVSIWKSASSRAMPTWVSAWRRATPGSPASATEPSERSSWVGSPSTGWPSSLAMSACSSTIRWRTLLDLGLVPVVRDGITGRLGRLLDRRFGRGRGQRPPAPGRHRPRPGRRRLDLAFVGHADRARPVTTSLQTRRRWRTGGGRGWPAPPRGPRCSRRPVPPSAPPARTSNYPLLRLEDLDVGRLEGGDVLGVEWLVGDRGLGVDQLATGLRDPEPGRSHQVIGFLVGIVRRHRARPRRRRRQGRSRGRRGGHRDHLVPLVGQGHPQRRIVRAARGRRPQPARRRPRRPRRRRRHRPAEPSSSLMAARRASWRGRPLGVAGRRWAQERRSIAARLPIRVGVGVGLGIGVGGLGVHPGRRGQAPSGRAARAAASASASSCCASSRAAAAPGSRSAWAESTASTDLPVAACSSACCAWSAAMESSSSPSAARPSPHRHRPASASASASSAEASAARASASASSAAAMASPRPAVSSGLLGAGRVDGRLRGPRPAPRWRRCGRLRRPPPPPRRPPAV